MAVFVYAGLVVATGKQVKGVRDADNPKVLRARARSAKASSSPRRPRRRAGKKGGRAINFGAFFSRVVGRRRRDDDAPARDAGRRGIPLVESVSALTEQVEKDELEDASSPTCATPQRRHEPREGARAARPHLPADLREHGRGRRGVGHARDGARAPRRLHGEAGPPPRQGQRGARVPDPHARASASVLMTMMMVVVVPKVTNIYATLDRALPWYTALLIFVSNALSSNEMLGFIIAVVALVFTRKALQPGTKKTACTVMAAIIAASRSSSSSSSSGRSFALRDRHRHRRRRRARCSRGSSRSSARRPGSSGTTASKLKLPLFGPVFRMLAVSRFSRTLATLLKSGVPLLKAMEIVRHVLDNAQAVEDRRGRRALDPRRRVDRRTAQAEQASSRRSSST